MRKKRVPFLRAVGAHFLVSAVFTLKVGRSTSKILSEAGSRLRLISPWQQGEVIERDTTSQGKSFVLIRRRVRLWRSLSRCPIS